MCDFKISSSPDSTFQVLTPQKKPPVLIWTKKHFFEDFYMKNLNWKRKRSNSNFQVKCEYQTTTNIAFLCKMVRVPFLLSMFWEFHTRHYLSGMDSPKKGSVTSWFGPKNLFWRLLHKEFELEKKKVKFNFQVKCEYQTATNIAFLCNMLRVPFLLCAIWKFPTRKYLSGMDSPKKASGLDLDQKNLFRRLLHKEFELEKKTVKFQTSG